MIKETCIFKDRFYHWMGTSYFHNDTFVILQYKFKVRISLTTNYTSPINTSKVLNFGFKFRYSFARFNTLRRLFQIRDPLEWTELVP